MIAVRCSACDSMSYSEFFHEDIIPETVSEPAIRLCNLPVNGITHAPPSSQKYQILAVSNERSQVQRENLLDTNNTLGNVLISTPMISQPSTMDEIKPAPATSR